MEPGSEAGNTSIDEISLSVALRPNSERGTSNWRFEARKALAGSSHSSASANESTEVTEGERRRFNLEPERDAGLASDSSFEAFGGAFGDE